MSAKQNTQEVTAYKPYSWQAILEFRAMWVLLALGLVLPFVISKPLATEIMIYALFALAFNLMLGHTGIISFGHAGYLGAGAYAGAMVVYYGGVGVWVSLLAAMAGGTVIAVLIGLLAVKRKGAYFAMISLAIAQMLYFLALSPFKRWTDGEDSLKLPPLSVDFPFHIDLSDQLSLYYFVFVIVALAVLVQWRILSSPFGHALKGIRENEDRIRACGFNITRIKFLSIVYSGLFSGLAGGLLAIYLGAASITILFWMTSGIVVMQTVLGGTHTFMGPFIGTAVFLYLRNAISNYTDRWEMWVGAMFMALILLFPEGIWGTVMQKIGERRRPSAS
ncbi:MAG: branched-chain amino acid ABC transporter permease [Desulfarculaceae bacterium]|nr:branched-chain amino acid ABC transporter permease [Desulfarculaceae bacterium]MCF8046087.1 branched-chain amino acid ABC transporter permease [Desulfarculaceae bacterium]MCF8064805.1 branched-chain amino acid ABC transporter permease [Desulfarculaceae bacterium]MCF8098989.1 branched-chain amino acid ABC transporter permease [Desulfarculaceae bacterium]MCF8121259.1 branched-chain amino acid ABC transporter permease [Desulfarculaceae bacterium]